MSEKKSPRQHATQAASKIPGMVRAFTTANLQAKEEGKTVAYSFISGLHDEILRAMDIVPAWTENYAGICAAKRDATRFLVKAESENFSRSLCTYATCGIGFDIWREELGEMPPDPPWGGQVKPDILLGQGQMLCDPRYKWYQALQHYMDVPMHVINLPFPAYEENITVEEVQDYYIKYSIEELKALISFLEKQTGKKMDWDKLSELIELSDRTWTLIGDVYDLRRAIPCPMDTGDAMNTMVPTVYMMGTQAAYDFYKELYDELKYKIDNKIGVVEEEKYRLLWGGGLPPWFALADFNYFNSKGAVFAAEVTYRIVEPIEKLGLPKTNDPLEHLAWRWLKYWTYWYDKARKRPGSYPDVERLIEYIEDYKIDGIIMHTAFSCRSWHVGLLWQLDLLEKVYGDIPSLVLESDIVDASSYSEVDTHNRIDTFIETLEAAKNK